MDSYNSMLQILVKQLESKIRDYLVYLREDKKVAAATTLLYLAVITHFYEMNGPTSEPIKRDGKYTVFIK